jgi:hypothetical protein
LAENFFDTCSSKKFELISSQWQHLWFYLTFIDNNYEFQGILKLSTVIITSFYSTKLGIIREFRPKRFLQIDPRSSTSTTTGWSLRRRSQSPSRKCRSQFTETPFLRLLLPVHLFTVVASRFESSLTSLLNKKKAITIFVTVDIIERGFVSFLFRCHKHAFHFFRAGGALRPLFSFKLCRRTNAKPASVRTATTSGRALAGRG